MFDEEIYGTADTSVGPNTDGTYNLPSSVGIPQPVDSGGGAPGLYSKDVLDVFKYGVGVWAQQNQQQNLLDYKRYEATKTGLWGSGQPAQFSRNVNGGGAGNLLILAGIVIGAVMLLQHKG